MEFNDAKLISIHYLISYGVAAQYIAAYYRQKSMDPYSFEKRKRNTISK